MFKHFENDTKKKMKIAFTHTRSTLNSVNACYHAVEHLLPPAYYPKMYRLKYTNSFTW